MFDLFSSALGGLLSGSRPIGRRRPTNGAELAWTLALLGFPLLDFVLVSVALPERDPQLAPWIVLGAPVGFTLITVWLCKRSGATLAWTLQAAFVCLLFCLAAGFVAGLFSVF
jgi:hypothetical protein